MWIIFAVMSVVFGRDCDLVRYAGETGGCLYESGHPGHLVIYLRGHWVKGGYAGHVPAIRQLRLNSVQNVIERYGVLESTRMLNMPVFISAASNVGIAAEEIQRIRSKLGVSKLSVTLVSHSGSHVGLRKTLAYKRSWGSNVKIKRVVMLDNFFFGGAVASEIASAIKGLACGGFYTKRNQWKIPAIWRRVRSAQSCPLDYLTFPKAHYSGVNKCLSAYIQGRGCT